MPFMLTLNEALCVCFEPSGKAVDVQVISAQKWEAAFCLFQSLWLLPK